MATITRRKRRDGSTAYRAEVRIMRDGRQAFRAVQTFDRRPDASAWAAALERTWQQQAADDTPPHTVAALIGAYLARRDALKPVGRSRRHLLAAIAAGLLGSVKAADVRETHLIEFCQTRRASGAGPATVLLDFVSLQTLYNEAKPLLGLNLDNTAFRAARPHLVRLGLIAKPHRRKRRVQSDELNRLLAHFRKRLTHAGSLIPMADIVEFAVYTCLRQGEIVRMTWADFDETRRCVIVRDRKSPHAKAGNDQEIPLLGPAHAIAARQPRLDARIFPFEARSISAAFTRSCQQLGIENLHFHDLRREGISRLLEMGYSVPEVATVSGHKDLNILWQIYTAITPEHLHEKWKERT